MTPTKMKRKITGRPIITGALAAVSHWVFDNYKAGKGLNVGEYEDEKKGTVSKYIYTGSYVSGGLFAGKALGLFKGPARRRRKAKRTRRKRY